MNRTIFTSIDQCRENHENWDVELTSVFCKLKVKKFLVQRESPNPSITLDQAVDRAYKNDGDQGGGPLLQKDLRLGIV